MYKILDHTADIGLAVTGKNLVGIFHDAGQGLFHLITEPVQSFEKRTKAEKEFDLSAENATELLRLWLRELLFEFSARRSVLIKYIFKELAETRLKAKASGYIFDPRKDVQRYEVKAVTYHGLKLEKNPSDWYAEVIFDI